MKYDYLLISEFYQDMIKVTELRNKNNEVEIKYKLIYLIKAFSDSVQTSFIENSFKENSHIFPIMDYVAQMRNIFRSLNKNIQNEIISSVFNMHSMFKIKFIPSEYIGLEGMKFKRSAFSPDILYEYILEGNYDIPSSEFLSGVVKSSFFKRPKINVSKRLLYNQDFTVSSNSINLHREVYFLYIHDNTFSDLRNLIIFTDIEERSNVLLFNKGLI